MEERGERESNSDIRDRWESTETEEKKKHKAGARWQPDREEREKNWAHGRHRTPWEKYLYAFVCKDLMRHNPPTQDRPGRFFDMLGLKYGQWIKIG